MYTKGGYAMKFLKIITLLMFLDLMLIGLDAFTLTAKWRFYGWEMFYKNDSDVLPKSVNNDSISFLRHSTAFG